MWLKKIKICNKLLNLTLKIPLVKRHDEDVKEKKVELIVDNERNQEKLIIENIVEYPIEVKFKNKSITHNR